jgi:predicted RNA binding protein with dsRBD fold (UPF0201 family)
MVEVRLIARCYKTEDREKIVSSIKALFPDARVEGNDPIVARSDSVDAFGEILRRERIRDAARVVLRKGISDRSTHFMLNKQVAAVGKISFSQEAHPLGDIDVTISDQDIEAVVDKLAPRRPVAEA